LDTCNYPTGAHGVTRPANGTSLRPALSEPAALQKIGTGLLVVVDERDGHKIYGRAITVADVLHDGRIIIAKWVRRLTNGGTRHHAETWFAKSCLLGKAHGEATPADPALVEEQSHYRASASPGRRCVSVDRYGVAQKPFEQEVLPPDCAQPPRGYLPPADDVHRHRPALARLLLVDDTAHNVVWPCRQLPPAGG
jgi:hypothetical protein